MGGRRAEVAADELEFVQLRLDYATPRPNPLPQGERETLTSGSRALRTRWDPGSGVLLEVLHQRLILVFLHGEAVLGLRELAFAHVLLEVGQRLADVLPAIGVALHELRREAI